MYMQLKRNNSTYDQYYILHMHTHTEFTVSELNNEEKAL